MSFERTKGSITSLSGGNISADDLLDMLVCVTRDVFDANKITNAAALRVNDQTVLLKKMYNLMKMILVIYNGNQAGITQFSEKIRANYAQAIESLTANEALLSEIEDNLSREEQTRAALREMLADVDVSRSQLLAVKEECDAIQAKLDRLNDPALDEMAVRKTAMEAELLKRQSQAEALTKDQAKLQVDLDKVDAHVTELETTLTALREQQAALQAEDLALVEEKSRLEESIATLRAQIEEAKQRLGDLPATRDQVDEAYQQIQMQMTVMLNALNSAKNDTFLTENLYALPGSSKAFTVDNYPDLAIAGKKIKNWDELEAWFGELEARIDGLLEVLRRMLEVLVKTSESITARTDPE